VGQVEYLRPGDLLEIKEKKTKKYRAANLNHAAHVALDDWLLAHPRRDDPAAPLFVSSQRNGALSVSTVSRMVKSWCRDIGLHGRCGSLTMRKTWGCRQRKANDAPLPLLMRAYGHYRSPDPGLSLRPGARVAGSVFGDGFAALSEYEIT